MLDFLQILGMLFLVILGIVAIALVVVECIVSIYKTNAWYKTHITYKQFDNDLNNILKQCSHADYGYWNPPPDKSCKGCDYLSDDKKYCKIYDVRYSCSITTYNEDQLICPPLYYSYNKGQYDGRI